MLNGLISNILHPIEHYCRPSACFYSSIFLLCLLTLCFHANIAYSADSYQRVELQHRNASVLQETLAPLLGESVSISAEGRVLLIRAPQAEIKSLLTLVRSLDRPHRRLQIAIYRGIDPTAFEASSAEAFADQRWSTQTSRNRLDRLSIVEGQTLVLTEERLVSLPIGHRQTVGIGNEQTLSLKELPFPNSAFQTRDEYTDWLSTEEGIYLTPVIIGEKAGQPQVSMQVQYSLPYQEESASKKVSIPLKTSVVSVIELNQWQLVASHSTQSQRQLTPANSARTRLSTTQKGEDLEQRVWIKINLVKP